MDETFSCSQEKSANNKRIRIILPMDTPTYRIKRIKKNQHFKQPFFRTSSLIQHHRWPHLETLQKGSQNHFKHLRWSFFSKIVSNIKLLTVAEKAPSSMFDKFLTMSLIPSNV